MSFAQPWLRRSASLSWLHWLVVLISAAVTIGAFVFSQRQVNEKNVARFEREANQVLDLVVERLSKYEDGLWGGVGLFMGSNQVSLPEWQAYARALSLDTKYPGVNGLGVILHVAGREGLADHEQRQQAQQPGYTVHPVRDTREFFPITYIVPQRGNEAAIGLDVGHEENRRRAAERARETGGAQITGPIVLVQDETHTPGFLLYVPFYRKAAPIDTAAQRRDAFVGFVYAPFVVKKLMDGTLAAEHRLVRVRIRDEAGGETLFEESGDPELDDPAPMFQRTIGVDLYGRRWEFDIHASRAFRRDAETDLPFAILAGGMLADGMLLALFVTFSGARRRAVEMADALQERTRSLERSNRDLEEFASAVSHDLKAPLRGIHSLCGWIHEDCAELLPPNSREHLALIERRIARMNALLDDLLQYARLDAIEKRPEPVDLQELIDETLEWLAPEKPVELSVDTSGSGRLTTSRTHLQIVLRNLVQNAIRHNGADVVRIQVGARRDEAGGLVVSVEDNGPGIPARFADEVFRMFRKLASQDDSEGSGIGLATVKRVVEGRGGWIRLVVPPGGSDARTGLGGARFEFGWPASD